MTTTHDGYATAPHTTLTGGPSVQCPHGCDVHGTPAEIVQHLTDRHRFSRFAGDQVKASTVATYFSEQGDSDTALRIFAAIDEILIAKVAGGLVPIPTPVGPLYPGETVSLVVNVHGAQRRINNVVIPPNPNPKREDPLPFNIRGTRGYNTVSFVPANVLEIKR